MVTGASVIAVRGSARAIIEGVACSLTDLPRDDAFSRLADTALYTPLPADRIVGTSDIVGSTDAIAGGRNINGEHRRGSGDLGQINGAGGKSFPYVFGGGGEVFAHPPAFRDVAAEALQRSDSGQAKNLTWDCGSVCTRFRRSAPRVTRWRWSHMRAGKGTGLGAIWHAVSGGGDDVQHHAVNHEGQPWAFHRRGGVGAPKPRGRSGQANASSAGPLHASCRPAGANQHQWQQSGHRRQAVPESSHRWLRARRGLCPPLRCV